MTIHYGKRNPGLLTAASPGDTLYIPLSFYQDSGASVSIGNTLIAGDIEIFKNGSVTQRATDSGYAVLGDTGNFDNRIGFKGISVQLFNTADDASFYAVGSTYWVAIDNVTVDGRTVRFWPAVFEIGEPRANIVQINGDTGAASVLALFAGTGGTLSPTGGLDTGSVDNNSYLIADAKRVSGDTGAADVLRQFAATNGTLSPTGELDTGSVANLSYLPANVTRWLGTAAASPTVAGVPKVEVVSLSDTGLNDSIGRIRFDVDTGLRAQISDVDTGIHDTLADYDTGMRAIVSAIKTKTDSLTFTVTGEVDANIKAVNNTTVNGSGTSGNPWGP